MKGNGEEEQRMLSGPWLGEVAELTALLELDFRGQSCVMGFNQLRPNLKEYLFQSFRLGMHELRADLQKFHNQNEPRILVTC